MLTIESSAAFKALAGLALQELGQYLLNNCSLLSSHSSMLPLIWAKIGYIAYICRAVVQWIRKYFYEALSELERAITLDPEEWDAYFWQGVVYASLGEYEEAVATIEKSLELGLPPVLLFTLRWFEQDRPDFYENYALPLLACY